MVCAIENESTRHQQSLLYCANAGRIIEVDRQQVNAILLTASMDASSPVASVFKKIAADVSDQSTTKKRAGKIDPFFWQSLPSGECLALSCCVSIGHFVPVDDIPKRTDVVGPSVLIIQIVSMFPDIETEYGGSAFH